MKRLRTVIVTPDACILDEHADSVIIPGAAGLFGVLPDHAPLVSVLQTGIVRVRSGNSEKQFAVDTGFARVHDNSVHILAGAAAPVDGSNNDEVLRSLRERRIGPPLEV